MRKITSCLLAVTAAIFFTAAAQAQSFENTYVWAPGQDHSAWKGLTNYPTGYVIVGSKFFEPANTNIYITGFNDFSQHQWTITHPTAQHGFSQLDVLWKSFTNTGTPSNPQGFFVATSGTRNGQHQYYTLTLNKTGNRIYERFGALPEDITFGGTVQAVNGGFIAVGSNSAGNVAVVKFTPLGELEWYKILPYSGFAWTVQQAVGGGYVIGSTNRRATRIDQNGNVVWTTTVSLPPSPAPDGSAYTYSEFEEITPLQNTGTGFVMTGSVFSNSTSAVYTARLNWNGSVSWSKINDAQNTNAPGTPVAWANSAVEMCSMATGVWDIIFTWRRGPVSAGGTLFAERMNPLTGATLQKGSLLNNIPVQEAFTVRQYLVNRIIIAGTRGGYSAAYSYASANLPYALTATDDRSEPLAEQPLHRLQISRYNALPEFEDVEAPAGSGVFQSELRVWPNPASDAVNVGGKLEAGAWVRLVSTTGQVVAERQVQTAGEQFSLDLTGTHRGLYYVQVVGANGVTTKAVVVE